MKKTTFAVVILLMSLAFTIGCIGQIAQPQDDPPNSIISGSGSGTGNAVVRSGTVFVGDSIFGRMPLDVYFPGKGYINGGWFGQLTDQILAVFPAILDGSNVCHGYNAIPGDPAFPFSCQQTTPPSTIFTA